LKFGYLLSREISSARARLAAVKFYLRPKGQNFALNFTVLKIVKFRAVKFCSDGHFGLLCGGISSGACVLKDEILSRRDFVYRAC